MTPKQQRFVEEYLIDLNATQAAIRAGYSEKTAHQQGSHLLTRQDVATAMASAQAERRSRLEISADSVVRELAKIGFANMADYMHVGPDGDPYLDFSAVGRDQAAALVEVTVEDFKDGRGEDARDVRRVKFKLGDKRAALVDLGKHLGLFKERGENDRPDKNEESVPANQDRSALEAVLAGFIRRGATNGHSGNGKH